MSEKKEIVRAAGVLGGATILSRIMGMVRDMVVSRLFGAGMATDAFFAAFQIPNMLRRFFAEGALTSAFVPTFTEYCQKGEEDARHLARVAFSVLLVVMSVVTLLGILFSPLIVRLMFPGFAADPQKFSLTVTLNRIMFPYIFCISIVALFMGILNTVRHFLTPALSTILLNLSMIGGGIFLHDRFEVPIVSLAIGVIIGGILQVILQIPPLHTRGFSLSFVPDFSHPAVRRIMLLMGPSVFGVGVYYLNMTVSAILASLLPQGSVSYLYYAQRLFEFPQGIVTVSIAQAVLPAMSRQAASGDLEAMKESLSFGLRLVIFITVPAMAGLYACSTPILSLLFMGGAFGYETVVRSAEALQCYLLGLSVVAMVRVTVPAFHARKDTKSPVIAAFVAFLANLLASLLLMGPLHHAGLALASSISSLVNLLLLLWMLRRQIGGFGGGRIVRTLLRTLAASIPMGVGVSWVINQLDWSFPGDRLFKGGVLMGVILVGGGLYLLLARVAGSEEMRDLLTLLRSRIARRRGGG